MLKKLLNKLEENKFNKLVNTENNVIIRTGNELIEVYNKDKKISYAPVAKLSIR